MTSQKNVPTNEQALAEEARQLAVSLADALAASAMPDDQKAAWAALIPEMRLDQLSRFATVLDVYLSRAVKDEVADVIQKMRTILEKYAAIQSQTDNAFMTDVAGMVQQLRAAEKSSARVD
ncbi:MAG: hypothetical protein AAB839_02900 [Patescibacteria group bacterium]